MSSSAPADPRADRTAADGSPQRAPEEFGEPFAPGGQSDVSGHLFLYPEVARVAGSAWGAAVADTGANEERVRASALREGEERARVWYSTEVDREREALRQALEGFARQREKYFLSVEREAVQLSLTIARKVLEREMRADPLAVAAMVHVALAPLASGTEVTLRVHPAAAQDWRMYFAARDAASPGIRPLVAEDESLAPGDCRVVTAMGTAEISLGQKLKEIETSFLELLAQRPGSAG